MAATMVVVDISRVMAEAEAEAEVTARHPRLMEASTMAAAAAAAVTRAMGIANHPLQAVMIVNTEEVTVVVAGAKVEEDTETIGVTTAAIAAENWGKDPVAFEISRRHQQQCGGHGLSVVQREQAKTLEMTR